VAADHRRERDRGHPRGQPERVGCSRLVHRAVVTGSWWRLKGSFFGRCWRACS
jgi:hypothetical protein